MPHERKKDHSHNANSTNDPLSWWQKFHFSGKVIMCSVLFGLGLVLIGGLLLAIGADKHDENNGDLNEVQNKAPMSIVGPIIMGIGGFTVFTGIIMCLFETNICRKRQPDARPLIDEQNSEAASRSSDATSIPSTTQKREKHRHHKKSSSPRKHKTVKKSEQGSNHSSPSSMPIDMHRSISRDLTSSDKFLTPPSSIVSEHPKLQPTYSDAENQTSASLMKSFTSSGKSWNTCTEFQTPSSSLQDNSGSFEDRIETLGISPENKELNNDRLLSLKHEFVTPQNSSAEIIDDLKETSPTNLHEETVKSKEFNEEITEKLDVLNHAFVTPMNSYVDQPNVAAPKMDAVKDDAHQLAPNFQADDIVQNSSEVKSTLISFDLEVQKSEVGEGVHIERNVEEKLKNVDGETHTVNDESVLSNHSDFESKEAISTDLKQPIEISDTTLTTENNSHFSDKVAS